MKSWNAHKICSEPANDEHQGIDRHAPFVLAGLDVSAINHAADMLTVQFGPLRETVTRKGTMKRVGLWALHVQCHWQIEPPGVVVATKDDLYGPDEKASLATERLEESLVRSRVTTVESVAGS